MFLLLSFKVGGLEACCPLALGLIIDLFFVLVYFFFVFINDLSKMITLNNLKILSRLIQFLNFLLCLIIGENLFILDIIVALYLFCYSYQ